MGERTFLTNEQADRREDVKSREGCANLEETEANCANEEDPLEEKYILARFSPIPNHTVDAKSRERGADATLTRSGGTTEGRDQEALRGPHRDHAKISMHNPFDSI